MEKDLLIHLKNKSIRLLNRPFTDTCFVTCIGHLENTGSLSYVNLLKVDSYQYVVTKKTH